jgi:chromosome segregation ATPase
MPQGRIGRIALAVLVVGLIASWVMTYRTDHDNRRLSAALDQAHTSIVELESERQRLEQELAQASETVQGQDVKIGLLQAELTDLEGLFTDAEQEIGRLQAEQSAMLARNQDLTNEFALADQERTEMRTKLSSVKELKLAIKSVRRELRQQRRQVWLAKIEAQRARDQQLVASGNRGFVVRNGASTLAASPRLRTRLQVRVLEPQAE